MKRVVLLAAAAGVLWPMSATAQQCEPTQQTIGWSQPNKVPIASENAVRWPIDGSFRVAFSGTWCPTEDQVELVRVDTDDGELNLVPIPAQVRIRTPFTLVTNTSPALTLLEIDPEPELEARGDYRIIMRPPTPALEAFREYVIEFRTRGGDAGAFPDFEGIREVGLDGGVCGETGSFRPADNNNPACPIPNHLRLLVTFQPVDRADVAYIIYRESSTPLDAEGNPVEAEADNTPIPLQYENGARDLFGTGVPVRQVRLAVPYYPLARRDCFSVRALDEWGRERGGADNIVCADLQPIHGENCPLDQCSMMQCGGLVEPNPFEASPPIPGQSCPNLGLGGGDPDREIPPVGEEPEPDPPMLDDGGMPVADGGVGASEDDGGGGGGGASGCRVDPGAESTPLWPLALLGLPLLVRRRRHHHR